MSKRPRLQLWGSPDLFGENGTSLQFRTRKQFALLTYLALEAREESVLRLKLADLIWPDASKKSALHSLSQGLSEIRKLLGNDALETDRQSVRLCIDIDIDLEADPGNKASIPLEGAEDWASRRFAEWVEVTRDRIRTEIRARLDKELSDARSRGRVSAVRERAELLYSVDPHSDAAVQALAEERFSSGDWAGGIRLVRKHISDSEQKLGRSPSAEVLATLRRFERGVLKSHTGDEEDNEQQAPSNAYPHELTGRDTEVARLEALLYDVERGDFRSCAIRGPDGIGKTAILRRFSIAAATRNVPSYFTCCHEIGKNIPFAAVSELLDQLALDPALSGTDPIWLAEASRVSPRIRVAYPGIPDPLSTSPETVRLRLAQAINEMLDVVADGCPAMLTFDDIHHMDSASRHVLHMLARNLENSAMLLLASSRCSEAELDFGIGAGLEGVNWTETIGLRPLDDAAVRQLVSSLSASVGTLPNTVLANIVRLAQGNPYLAEMLVADWKKNGAHSIANLNEVEDMASGLWQPSDTMSEALARQVGTLSRNARHILQLLATAGRTLCATHLASILGLEINEVNIATLELIECSLVRIDEGAFELRSQVHRALIYSASMTEETRRQYHAFLTEFFKATRNERDCQRTLEASHHAIRAGFVDDAMRFVTVGSEAAISSGAPQQAAEALERIRRVWPSRLNSGVLILLAKAYSTQGAYERSLCILRDLDCRDTTDGEDAVAAHLRAEALHRGRLSDSYDEIVSAARHAMEAALEIDDQRLALKAQQIAAEIAHDFGRWDALRIIESECAKVEVETHDTEVRGLASLTLGFCKLASGESQAAAQFFSHSAQLFRLANLSAKRYNALNGLGMATSGFGDYASALRAFADARSAARAAGDYVAHTNALLNLGSLSNELGRFDQAAGYFRRAFKTDRAVSSSRVSTALYCNAANLAISLGNFCEAEEFLHTAAKGAARSTLWQHSVSVRLTNADLYLAMGEDEKAWPLVESTLAEVGDRHRLVPDLGQYWRLRRHYYFTTGDGETRAAIGPTLITTAHLLELQAFEEWCAQDNQFSSACQQLVRLGLFGVLARLAAVGVRIGPVFLISADLPGAHAVRRAFPEAVTEYLPESIKIFE